MKGKKKEEKSPKHFPLFSFLLFMLLNPPFEFLLLPNRWLHFFSCDGNQGSDTNPRRCSPPRTKQAHAFFFFFGKPSVKAVSSKKELPIMKPTVNDVSASGLWPFSGSSNQLMQVFSTFRWSLVSPTHAAVTNWKAHLRLLQFSRTRAFRWIICCRLLFWCKHILSNKFDAIPTL